jgi:hypothetical protein
MAHVLVRFGALGRVEAGCAKVVFGSQGLAARYGLGMSRFGPVW